MHPPSWSEEDISPELLAQLKRVEDENRFYFKCPCCEKLYLYQHLLDKHLRETHTLDSLSVAETSVPGKVGQLGEDLTSYKCELCRNEHIFFGAEDMHQHLLSHAVHRKNTFVPMAQVPRHSNEMLKCKSRYHKTTNL